MIFLLATKNTILLVIQNFLSFLIPRKTFSFSGKSCDLNISFLILSSLFNALGKMLNIKTMFFYLNLVHKNISCQSLNLKNSVFFECRQNCRKTKHLVEIRKNVTGIIKKCFCANNRMLTNLNIFLNLLSYCNSII